MVTPSGFPAHTRRDRTMTRLLLWTAILEAVLVVVLGIAVLWREPRLELHGGSADEPTAQKSARDGDGLAGAGGQPSKHAAAKGGAVSKAPRETGVTDEPVAANDPVGVVLFGAVAGADGSAIRSFVVWLTRLGEEKQRPRKFYTDRGHPYTFAGVPPGRYRLRCSSNNFVAWKREIDVTGNSRVERHDLLLQRKIAIRVRFVTSAGERSADPAWFERYAVIATEAPLPDRIPILPGGNLAFPTLGSWRPNRGNSLPPEFAGQVLLSQPPPVYLNAMVGPKRLQTLRVREQQREATFTIDTEQIEAKTASVRVSLADAATGRPVLSAMVRIGEVGLSPNQQGIFRRSRMPPGVYGVSVWTDGAYERLTLAIAVDAGQQLDLGTIALAKGQTCSGVVVDAAGKGGKAQLIAFSLDRGHRRWPLVRGGPQTSTKGVDGSFALKGLGAGRCLIRAATVGQTKLAYTTFDGSKPLDDLRLVLQPSIPVRIESHVGKFEQVTVTVRNADGDPVWCRQVGSRSGRGPRLLPGVYRVEIFGAGRKSGYRLTVAGENTTMEVR